MIQWKYVKLLEFGHSLYSHLLWIKPAKEVHPINKKDYVLFRKKQNNSAVELGKTAESSDPSGAAAAGIQCSYYHMIIVLALGPQDSCLFDLKKLNITVSETSD